MNQEILNSRDTHLKNLKSIYRIGNFDSVVSQKEEVWARLLDNKKFKMEELNKQKTIQEQTEMKKTCTFKPQISSRSKKLAERRNSLEQEKKPAYERLHSSSKNSKHKTKLKKEIAVQDSQNEIIERDSELASNSFVDRITNYQKERQIKKEKLKRKVESSEGLEFKPKISEKSKVLAEKQNLEYLNVIDRLQADLYKRQKLRKRFDEVKEEIEIENCTFKPIIKENPEIMIPNNDEDFFTRQDEYEIHKKIKNQIQKKQKDTQFSFKPQINMISELLVNEKESINERVNRLYNEYKLQDAHKSQMSEIIAGSYTYKPVINEVSKFIARHRTHKDIENVQKKPQRIEKESFSYQPNLTTSSTYKDAQSTIKNYDAEEISHQKRIRQLISEEMSQKEKAEKELAECSFKPKINTSSKKRNPSKAKVAGMEKHLAQMERKRRKEQDDEAYRKKVWNLQTSKNIRAALTIH